MYQNTDKKIGSFRGELCFPSALPRAEIKRRFALKQPHSVNYPNVQAVQEILSSGAISIDQFVSFRVEMRIMQQTRDITNIGF